MTSTKRQASLGSAPPMTRVEWAIARYNWYRACGMLSDSPHNTVTTTHERSPDAPPPKPHLKWYPLSKPDDDLATTYQPPFASTQRHRYSQRVEAARHQTENGEQTKGDDPRTWSRVDWAIARYNWYRACGLLADSPPPKPHLKWYPLSKPDADVSTSNTILARYQAEKEATKGSASNGQFDASKHPRAEAGQRNGGQFVKAGEGTTAAATEPFEQHFTTPLRQHYVVSSHPEWKHKQHSGLHVPGLGRDQSKKFLELVERGSALRNQIRQKDAELAKYQYGAWTVESQADERRLQNERSALVKQWRQLDSEFDQHGFGRLTTTGYQEGVDNKGRQVKARGTGLGGAVQAFDKSHSPIEGDSGWRQIHHHSSATKLLTDPVEPIPEEQRSRELQKRIAERQSQVDALTRQQDAAVKELKQLKGHYIVTRATRDRIKTLEAFINYSQQRVKRYQAEINRDRASLSNGLNLPDLPKLTETGPSSREGGRPLLKWIKDARIMGELASASYEDVPLSKTATDLGWSKVRDFRNDETSFNAVLFVNHKTGEAVLGFAGTTFEDRRDLVVANGRQGLGFQDRQYEQAIQLTAQLKKKFPNLRLTGHSLGGGLASAAAIVNRIGDTVTFNAAGVHPWTVNRHKMNLSNATELIRAFRVQGEVLSSLRDGRLPIPKILQKGPTAPATQAIPYLMPDGVGTNYWLDSGSGTSIAKHGMDHIQKGLSRPAP
jgi:hypothetical protein